MTVELIYSTGTGLFQEVLARPWLFLICILALTALLTGVTALLSREWLQLRHKKWMLSLHDLYEQAMDRTTDAVLILDGRGTILSWNRASEELLGYSKEEMLQQPSARLVPGDRRLIQNALDRCRQEMLLPLKARHKDGRSINLLLTLQPHNHFYTATLRFDEFKPVTVETTWHGDKDVLTGLPNRTAFLAYLEEQTAIKTFAFSVSFLSIDSFPRLAEALGRKPSERLLLDMTDRLQTVLPKGAFLARWSDCVFALILPDEDVALAGIWEQLRQKLKQPFSVNGLQLFAPLSIGTCFYPQDGKNAEMLLQHAYVAKRQAKQIKDTSVSYFDASMMSQIERMFQLEADLPMALSKQELELHYQPQVNLADRSIVSAEALLRWNHPELGLISPLEFIPIAEETETIVPIGWWVIEEALREFHQLKANDTPLQQIAVNVSLIQLERPDFAERLELLLHRYQVNAACLEIELTESIMQESSRLTGVLEKLQEIGVTIALDDFGTGYSSLSRLYSLPLDRLKIDKSFIDDIAVSPSALNVVHTVVYLAEQTGLDVVAEGVETIEQVHMLKELNCLIYQGYYFARPLAADALKGTLRNYQIPKDVPIGAGM
ncbi:putative bifunctional diguanylate cyclase/phosphodiesterase [Sinobaca qinghaiensis]|nr:GGDEF domain-containing phosphodiesterase [Sinobaca qinghaiensis]